jgi:hypothetical protein
MALYYLALGRPAGAVSLMASSADLSYRAVGPAYSFGLMPFVCNRLLAVSGWIFNSLAISAIVKPSAIRIYYRQFFSELQYLFHYWNNFLHRRIGKHMEKEKYYSDFGRFLLTYYSDSGII